MLLFLRKIRRKLISTDNKVITYLLYAIGEIFLVVIGILIAVQVDNWNEHRKLQEVSKFTVQKLKSELVDARDKLNESYKANEFIISKSEGFLTSDYPFDSLKNFPAEVFYWIAFVPARIDIPTITNETGLDSQINTQGNLKDQLWKIRSLMHRLDDSHNDIKTYWNTQVITFITESGHMSAFKKYLSNANEIKLDEARRVYDDQGFRNRGTIILMFNRRYNKQIEGLIDQIDETLETIEEIE